MRGFEKVFREMGVTQEQITNFINDGWGNDEFIKYLTPNELTNYFTLQKSPKKEKIIADFLNKIKNKSEILFPRFLLDIKDSWKISTGSYGIDGLLDHDGIIAGDLILFYGKFRSGKSQIAHQCCVNIFQYFQPFPEITPSIFIDTEGTFRPERIKQMSSGLNLQENKLLQSISIIQIKSVNEFEIFLPKLEEIIKTQKTRIILIDSLTSIFRVELAKPEIESAKTIQQFVKIGKKFLDWTQNYHVAIVCTSQITSAMSKTYFFDVIPVLAPLLNQFFKQSIFLAENEAVTENAENRGRRFAHLINGQKKKEAIAQFIITEQGIRDFY